MTMKRITKKQAKDFARRAGEVIAGFGFSEVPHLHNSWRCMTDHGPFIVHPPSHDADGMWVPHCCYDINGRFENAIDRATAGRLSVSLPSRKWNVLHSDADTVLNEFVRRMRQVNARPPTPEEAAEWAERDADTSAYWERMRSEFQATVTK